MFTLMKNQIVKTFLYKVEAPIKEEDIDDKLAKLK